MLYADQRNLVWSPPNLNRFVYSPGIINFQLWFEVWKYQNTANVVIRTTIQKYFEIFVVAEVETCRFSNFSHFYPTDQADFLMSNMYLNRISQNLWIHASWRILMEGHSQTVFRIEISIFSGENENFKIWSWISDQHLISARGCCAISGAEYHFFGIYT